MEAVSSAFRRTRGDGMENADTTKSDQKKEGHNLEQSLPSSSVSNTSANIPGALSIYRSNEDPNAPINLIGKLPQGKLIHLVPHLIGSKKNFSLKNKEPKFVPFEPYKAAVSGFRFAEVNNK